ncbi:MAG: NAD-dependent deacylase [Deltaproteobacteria bacterium]|jgi:NAD-dependent deacetylase|nr:NAD-dependent deacylase [Deltaproteobacteria bacterium]
MTREEQVRLVKERLGQAQKVVVLTGAGISAESGIPTFRGADGIWEHYRATDLATPEAFERDPELVWAFYNWRRELISRVKENPAHQALVTLEKIVPDFTLVTQNVDGLHQRAGSINIIEVHGNLWRVQCTECARITMDMSVDMGKRPHCRECGGVLRPDVVWFGESLDGLLLSRAEEAARTCDTMLVIGTSGIVYPVAFLPALAKDGGAFVAEINMEETPVSPGLDLTILGKAGEIMPLLVP